MVINSSIGYKLVFRSGWDGNLVCKFLSSPVMREKIEFWREREREREKKLLVATTALSKIVEFK